LTKVQKIALLSISTFILILSGFWIQNENKQPITMKPLVITPLKIKKETPLIEEPIHQTPTSILSKLKLATETSKESVIKLEDKKNKTSTSLKKIIVTKKAIPKRKPTVLKKTKVKKVKVNIIPTKKITLIQKANPIEKKIRLLKEKTKQLTREEEVALYKSTYADKLEIVNVSQNFEINEEETLPDSYYFKPIENKKAQKSKAPLEFVAKLGVVSVSNKYENNFTVSKKVELAKEGIVNFSHTSIDTKDLQKLEFVDTLGVIEVSEDFETINAKKYLN
jgi:hypothetical protein